MEASVASVGSGSSVYGTVASGGAVDSVVPVDTVTVVSTSGGGSGWEQPHRPRISTEARIKLKFFFIWHTSFLFCKPHYTVKFSKV